MTIHIGITMIQMMAKRLSIFDSPQCGDDKIPDVPTWLDVA
jgi:hypothetical protein